MAVAVTEGTVKAADRSIRVNRERIIAVGLLTQRDLDVLGENFNRAFPVDQTPCFGELLSAIDQADREMWQARDEDERKPS